MRVLGIALLSVFVFLGVIFTILLFTGAYAVSKLSPAEPPLPEKIVLHLDVANAFPETPISDPLAKLSARLSGKALPPTLREAVDAVDRAAQDTSVEALMVTVQSGSLGMAQAQELRGAITRFRNSGKQTVAFSETFGEMADGTVPYYVASAAEDIWLQPSGLVAATGFAQRAPYMRGFLDRIGVTPDFEARKDFKSFASVLTDYQQPEADRLAASAVLNGHLNQIISDIARDRKLPLHDVRTMVDGSPLLAQEALDGGMVQYLGYRDQLQAALKVSLRRDDGAPAPQNVTLDRYIRMNPPEPLSKDVRKVVYIAASGPILMGEKPGNMPFSAPYINARKLAEAIEKTVTDSTVAAIILRVDSPGGSYVGSDIVWRAIQQARETGMPVIASMGDVAASGGYFIAMGANKIVAQPGTLTGSIGVVSGKLAFDGLAHDYQIQWDGVQAGRNAAMFLPDAPFDEAGRARLNTILDAIYADFTSKAARARGLTDQQIESAAQGRVWTGEDALKMGLVDTLGGLPEVLELARTEAGLDPDAVVRIVPYDDGSEARFSPSFLQRSGNILTSLNRLESVGPILDQLEPFSGTLDRLKAGPITAPVIR